MAAGSLVYVGIAPHPPIMVPEAVVIVSPHAPLEARSFVAYADPVIQGDFTRFRAPAAEVSAPLDSELLDALERAAREDGFRIHRLRAEELDHGTAVPLYFLLRNGWRGRAVALGYSFLSDEDHVRFGAAVLRAADAVARRV